MKSIKKYFIYLLLIATTTYASDNSWSWRKWVVPAATVGLVAIVATYAYDKWVGSSRPVQEKFERALGGYQSGMWSMPPNAKEMEQAIKAGAQLNNPDYPSLFWAAQASDPETAEQLTRLLLKHGAAQSINFPSRGYLGTRADTALSWAVCYRDSNATLVKLLLENGAQWGHEITKDEKELLQRRERKEGKKVTNWLYLADALKTPPAEDISKIIGTMSEVEKKEARTMLSKRFENQGMPLTIERLRLLAMIGDSQAKKQIESVYGGIESKRKLSKVLSQRIADYSNPYYVQPVLVEPANKNFDAFMEACWLGDIATVRKLLDKVNINAHALNVKNMTPLIMASEQGHKKIVPILLDSGADATATDNEDNSALTMAIRNGHTAVVDTLLEYAEAHHYVEKQRGTKGLPSAQKVNEALKMLHSKDAKKASEMEKLLGRYINLNED